MDGSRITARGILQEVLDTMRREENPPMRIQINNTGTSLTWFYRQNPTAYGSAKMYLQTLIDDLEKEGLNGPESDNPNA